MKELALNQYLGVYGGTCMCICNNKKGEEHYLRPIADGKACRNACIGKELEYNRCEKV